MDEMKKYIEIEKKRRIEHLNFPENEKLKLNNIKKNFLKIAYMVSTTRVGGGTKIILEHANYLQERGHQIYLISHEEEPSWFNLNDGVQFIRVPYCDIVAEFIPRDVDVIVSTTPSSIYECIEQRIAPVIYFEQGDHHLFDRSIDSEERLDFIKRQYAVCNNIFTVSNYAKEKILEIYGKDSYVIPNAVNDKVFYAEQNKKNDDIIRIVAIGAEEKGFEFKGIKYILDAIKKIKEKYNVEFTWITPRNPITQIEKTVVNPTQIIIGDTLRNSDIYICASDYESFGLPILEAMSCGATVVTTDVGGNKEFSINNETCLLINKRDVNDIVKKVEILINDENLRNRLSENSLKKASEYNWKKTIDQLENYYKEIAKYTIEK